MTEEYGPNKEDKISEKELNEKEVSNIHEGEFKVIIIKMLNEHRRRTDKQKFKKKLENIKRNKTEPNYIITEIKNTPEGSKSRVDDTEEWISKLEDY